MQKANGEKVVSSKTSPSPRSAADNPRTSTPKASRANLVNAFMDDTSISNISTFSPRASHSAVPSVIGELHPGRMSIAGPSYGRSPSSNGSKKGHNSNKSSPNDDEILASFNALYQSEILKKIVFESEARAKVQIDKQLATLQKKISDDQEIIEKTKLYIQRIKTYSKMKSDLNEYKNKLKSTHGNVQQAVDKNHLNNAMVKELEKIRNQLECENTILPDSRTSSETMNETLLETLTASQIFSENNGNVNQMNKLLEEYQNLNKQIDGMNLCISGISQMNSSMLADMSFKVCENLGEASTNNDST